MPLLNPNIRNKGFEFYFYLPNSISLASLWNLFFFARGMASLLVSTQCKCCYSSTTQVTNVTLRGSICDLEIGFKMMRPWRTEHVYLLKNNGAVMSNLNIEFDMELGPVLILIDLISGKYNRMIH